MDKDFLRNFCTATVLICHSHCFDHRCKEERPNTHEVMQSLLLISSQDYLTPREGLELHGKRWTWRSPDLAGPLFFLPLVPPTSACLLVATQEHGVLMPYLQSLLFPCSAI